MGFLGTLNWVVGYIKRIFGCVKWGLGYSNLVIIKNS